MPPRYFTPIINLEIGFVCSPIWLYVGVSSLERLQAGEVLDNLGDEGHLAHVHLEPVGVVDLGHQEAVGQRDVIAHAVLLVA